MAVCTCIRCLGKGIQTMGTWSQLKSICELCQGNGVLNNVDPDCAAVIEKIHPARDVLYERIPVEVF